MKFTYAILFISFLSSCSYYRFSRINLVKTDATQVYERDLDALVPDVIIHINNAKKGFRLSEITTNDSSFIFVLDSTPIHTKQASYYSQGLDLSTFKNKKNVSGRIEKDEEKYVAQIHLIISDSLSQYDSTKFVLTNSQISDMHVVKQNEARSFLMLLLVFCGIITAGLLILFIVVITSSNLYG